MKVNHNITRAQRRKERTRKKVRGTALRPRLSVFRSNQTTYLQLINDEAGSTVAQANAKEVKLGEAQGRKTKEAIEIAKVLAKKAKGLGVIALVFDRGGYRYHGRVKAVADTLRQEGLQF